MPPHLHGADLRAGDIVAPLDGGTFEVLKFGRGGPMYREADIELHLADGRKAKSAAKIHHRTSYEVIKRFERTKPFDPYGLKGSWK